MSEHDHYFTAAPASADERRRLRVRLAGRDVEVEVAPGIFSPGGLDKGTAVLLDEAPAPPPTGTFLDLGCGWGPIALTLALRSPAATVLGASTSTSARSTSPAATPAALGLDGVHATTAGRHPGRRAVRPDLVQPADPGRQGRAARPAAHLAAAAGARRRRPTSSCRGTSARTPCSAGSRPSSGCRAPASRRAEGFRVLEVRHSSGSTTIAEPPPRRDGSAAAT